MFVIIDIQECYYKEFRKQQIKFEEMLRRIKRRIEVAKSINEPVINLTCFDEGFTNHEVIEMIQSCNGYFLCKNKEDGSVPLDKFIKKKKILAQHIELSGVFRDVCVLETWKGLIKLGYKVLPIDPNMTLATSTDRRKLERNLEEYPSNYIIKI